MRKDTVVPFAPRPAGRPEERGQRAEDLKAAELVEICKAMETGEGLEEVVAKWLGRIRIDPDAERPTPARGDPGEGRLGVGEAAAGFGDFAPQFPGRL